MGKKIAIVLSGCGFLDGAEIHESVMTLYHVLRNGAEPFYFAPNRPQHHVTNHLSKDNTNESRNVLAESARIARCDIQSLDQLNVDNFDAIIFPGGFGAALNLSDFAIKGAECDIDVDVERVIKDFHNAKKPIGVICIAPVLAAKVLGKKGVQVTIGNDIETAKNIENTGAKHVVKNVDEILVDEANRVVSTPAYMLAKNILDVDAGVSKLVSKVIEIA